MTEYPHTDSDGRRYRDITLPGGTFRTYEDDPFTARQVKQSPDEPDWIQPLYDAWARGDMRSKEEPKRNPKDRGILRQGPDGLYRVYYDMPLDEK